MLILKINEILAITLLLVGYCVLMALVVTYIGYKLEKEYLPILHVFSPKIKDDSPETEPTESVKNSEILVEIKIDVKEKKL